MLCRNLCGCQHVSPVVVCNVSGSLMPSNLQVTFAHFVMPLLFLPHLQYCHQGKGNLWPRGFFPSLFLHVYSLG